jgi:hypothetical protein
MYFIGMPPFVDVLPWDERAAAKSTTRCGSAAPARILSRHADAGALAGIFVGISAAVYWILIALAVVGGVLAGLEHPNAGEGAKRGVVGLSTASGRGR